MLGAEHQIKALNRLARGALAEIVQLRDQNGLLVLLIALLHFWVMGRPLSASIGGPLTTLLLFAAALAGALTGWRYRARRPALR